MERWICYQTAQDGRLLYVSHLPGEGGVDWGYDFRAVNARILTRRQALRWFREIPRRGASMRLL